MYISDSQKAQLCLNVSKVDVFIDEYLLFYVYRTVSSMLSGLGPLDFTH